MKCAQTLGVGTLSLAFLVRISFDVVVVVVVVVVIVVVVVVVYHT